MVAMDAWVNDMQLRAAIARLISFNNFGPYLAVLIVC